MSNILEKSLLTGLGILLLISFFSIIYPFWNQILNIDINSRNQYETYSLIMKELDQGITFINENPEGLYQKQIDYPENLNISVNNFYIKYDYIIGDQLLNTIIEYQCQFQNINYKDLNSQIYTLKIFNQLNLTAIQIF